MRLGADMISEVLGELPLGELDLLMIENVGNLVCPAEFKVGEDMKMMVLSMTEGDDQLSKFPVLFRSTTGVWRKREDPHRALHRVAEAMEKSGEPWPAVQDAYLRAWAARPTRAESLYMIAYHHRVSGSYRLGHLFAERAAAIPLSDRAVIRNPSGRSTSESPWLIQEVKLQTGSRSNRYTSLGIFTIG